MNNEMAQKARFSDMKRRYVQAVQQVCDTETLCDMIKSLLWDQYCNKLCGNVAMCEYIGWQISICQQQINKHRFKRGNKLTICY